MWHVTMQVRLLAALVVLALGIGAGRAQTAMEIKRVGPPTQRDYAILLVHGLSGTSGSFKNWIRMIQNDQAPVLEQPHTTIRLSQFDLFVADYVTRGANVSIHEIGQLMARELQDSDLFRKYDMVWVVVHSLGGVVFHEAALQLVAENKLAYFRFIPGFLELGVPVSGSEFANVGNDLHPLVVKHFGFDPKLVSELKTDVPYLGGLNTKWSIFAMARYGGEGWPLVFCGSEKIEEAWLAKFLGVTGGVVVPKLFSSDVCHSAKSPVPKKHTALHEVTSTADESHKLLRQMVRDSLVQLQAKRYQRQRGTQSLYQALMNMSVVPPPDRTTSLPLYKYAIAFSDPDGVTKDVTLDDDIKGWSLQDATRRLAKTYQGCLSVDDKPAEGTINIKAKAGAKCK
jgi:hypothetical protein